MAEKINSNRGRLNLALIFLTSSSFLITNYAPSINALEIPNQSGEFIIAKTPDERQLELVQQGVEQLPEPEASASPRQPTQPIDSPIPPTQTPTTPESTSTPQPAPATSQPSPTEITPQPTDSGSTPVRRSVPRQTTPQPTGSGSTPVRRSVPRQTTPQPTGSGSTPVRRSVPRQTTPQPTGSGSTPTPTRRSTPASSGVRRSTTNQGSGSNQNSVSSPASPSRIPNPRQINFVDIALGVLAPGDYRSQGRYFHFYQFEGRENQLIQIRLIGSGDQRRFSNLRLDPFMMLLDPNNNVLVKRGSGESTNNGGVKDAFMFIRLPVKGTYTIAVTSRNPGEIGRYSLALRNDRASYAIDEKGNLTASNLITKKNGSPYNISRFEGKRDQLVSIRVDSTFEEFSPYIVLMNSKGQVIAAENDKEGRYSALIDRVKLPEDGMYYVVVLSNSSQEKGTYRLTVF